MRATLRNLGVGVPSVVVSVALFGGVVVALVLAASRETVTAGAIVAYLYKGTHDELMAAKGRYAELFEMQSEWYR